MYSCVLDAMPGPLLSYSLGSSRSLPETEQRFTFLVAFCIAVYCTVLQTLETYHLLAV